MRKRIADKTPQEKLLTASRQVTFLHTKFELYKWLLSDHNKGETAHITTPEGKTISYTRAELTEKISELKIDQKAATRKLRSLALEWGKQIFQSLSPEQVDYITFQTGVTSLSGRNLTEEKLQLRKKLHDEYPAFRQLSMHINTIYGERIKKHVKKLVRGRRNNEAFHDYVDNLPEDFRIPIQAMRWWMRSVKSNPNKSWHVSSSRAYEYIRKWGKVTIISTPMQS
jgi:hypothetical protein